MSDELDRNEALDWVLDKLSAPRKAKAPVYVPVIKSQEDRGLEIAEARARELELWKKWHTGGQKPTDLDPILKSLQPKIQKRINVFKNRVEVPTAAIDFEHKKQVVNALKSYNPSKGKLSSWVENYLKKAGRFIQTNQNFARIPENISKYIGPFNAVKGELTEKLGYEPDDLTIHDYVMTIDHPKLGTLSLKDIRRINREQRKAKLEKGTEGGEELSSAVNLSDRENEVVRLIYYQLTPQERLVHEYTFGLNGKPALKSGQIAKKLKWDVSKVSKLKTSISNKMKPHLGI